MGSSGLLERAPAARALVAVALLCLGAFAAGSAAHAAPSALGRWTWSEPAALSGSALNAVACPSRTQCTAVDDNGDEITFNPLSPSGATRVHVGRIPPGSDINGLDSVALISVSCPSPTQCTALASTLNTRYVHEITFNPQLAQVAPARTVHGVAGVDADSVVCPSLTQCTLEAGEDDGKVVDSFNPASPGRGTAAHIAGGFSSDFTLACPAIGQCTSVTSDQTMRPYAREQTFDPIRLNHPKIRRKALGARVVPLAVACPAVSQCTAIAENGKRYTFDPRRARRPSVASVAHRFTPVSQDLPNSIACPTTHQCTVVDTCTETATCKIPVTWTFDPNSAMGATKSSPRATESLPSASCMDDISCGAIACPSTSECVTVSASGYSWTATSPPQAKSRQVR